MAQKVIEINCPGCGARVSTSQKECDWCHKPIIISTFNSIADMSLPEVNKYANAYKKEIQESGNNMDLSVSVGMCYLKLKMYDKAVEAFDKTIEENFDNSEIFFYEAIALLGGKKAFVCLRPNINKALHLLESANMVEPKGIYYYFLAYIKYDYFARKRFRISPDYIEEYIKARDIGLSEYDVEQLYMLLGVERPEVL